MLSHHAIWLNQNKPPFMEMNQMIYLYHTAILFMRTLALSSNYSIAESKCYSTNHMCNNEMFGNHMQKIQFQPHLCISNQLTPGLIADMTAL